MHGAPFRISPYTPSDKKERLMFAKIKSLFVAEVKTVESILSGWIAQVETLEQHAVDTLKASYGHREVAATAIDAAEALEAEATKAAAIATKIKAVITN